VFKSLFPIHNQLEVEEEDRLLFAYVEHDEKEKEEVLEGVELSVIVFEPGCDCIVVGVSLVRGYVLEKKEDSGEKVPIKKKPRIHIIHTIFCCCCDHFGHWSSGSSNCNSSNS
jgi:hypothetical protein